MLYLLFEELRNIRSSLFKQYFWGGNIKNYVISYWVKGENYCIYKFLLNLRIYEYLIKRKSFILKPFRLWYLRKYVIWSRKCGFTIGDGVLGEGVTFYHRANILINNEAKVGEGCKFHGDCCIGVAHTNDSKAPIIGKNVDIGVGSRILGDIYIADDIKIGANAVVTHSFYEHGITIAGIPAKKIER